VKYRTPNANALPSAKSRIDREIRIQKANAA
jgi:hypothetical protein